MSNLENDSFEVFENKSIIDEFIYWNKNSNKLYSKINTQVLQYSSVNVTFLHSNENLPYKRILVSSRKEHINKSYESYSYNSLLVLNSYEGKNYSNTLSCTMNSSNNDGSFQTKINSEEDFHSNTIFDLNEGNKWIKIENTLELDQSLYKFFSFPVKKDFNIRYDKRNLINTEKDNSEMEVEKDNYCINFKRSFDCNNVKYVNNIIFTIMNNNEIYLFADIVDLNNDSKVRFLIKLVIPDLLNTKTGINDISFNEETNIVSVACSDNHIYLFYLNIDNKELPNNNINNKSKNKVVIDQCFKLENDDEGILYPNSSINTHKRQVNCSKFSKKINNIIFSCGDDRMINVYDLRTKKEVLNFEAHNEEALYLDSSYYNQFNIISCSVDKSINLWDIRNTKTSVNSYLFHDDVVNKVQYCNFADGIFISSSLDRKVCLWDVDNTSSNSNVNSNNNIKDCVPSELLFVHGGHTSQINGFDVLLCNESNMEEYNLDIASVSNDNILQVWSPNNDVLN